MAPKKSSSARVSTVATRPPPPQSLSAPLTLTIAYVAWKLFILLISFGALIGPDYDTSTSIFFDVLGAATRNSSSDATSTSTTSSSWSSTLARRLTRWDAIYFVHGARVGYVYEQQWAFSPTLALFLRHLAQQARLVLGIPPTAADHLDAVAGIALAHVSHWVAVMALYKLTMIISGDNRKVSLLASLLCIISPAGVFLSAPYAESPFSALSFVGVLLLAVAYQHESGSLRRSMGVVGAGAVLGLATAIRSNGIANGLIFAMEALKAAAAFVKRPGVSSVVAAGAAGVGGILVALGSVIPQYVAYTIYCSGPDGALREWCQRTVPSIYTYVQDVYWNVGFLRYWTPNQIPLFILAAPVLSLLITSGYQMLRSPSGAIASMASSHADHQVLVQALAASQAVVALLALTSYHVQVISRLASGYAVWYWWVASCLMEKASQSTGRAVVIFMVMYGGIQAVLYSSFLPPA